MLYYILEQVNAHCRILANALRQTQYAFISFSIYSHGGNDMVIREYHPIQVNHQQFQVFQPFLAQLLQLFCVCFNEPRAFARLEDPQRV